MRQLLLWFYMMSKRLYRKPVFLVILVLIPVLYYTYTGALGVSADWFNITIFFLTAGSVFRLETKYLQSNRTCPIGSGVAMAMLFLIAAAFTVLTFIPPHIPLFQDPVTGTYGFWQA